MTAQHVCVLCPEDRHIELVLVDRLTAPQGPVRDQLDWLNDSRFALGPWQAADVRVISAVHGMKDRWLVELVRRRPRVAHFSVAEGPDSTPAATDGSASGVESGSPSKE
jgi:hypothetical protein